MLSQRCPRSVPEVSQKCPRRVPDVSQKCPRRVPEVFSEVVQKWFRSVPEVSQMCPRSVPQVFHKCPRRIPVVSLLYRLRSMTCSARCCSQIIVLFKESLNNLTNRSLGAPQVQIDDCLYKSPTKSTNCSLTVPHIPIATAIQPALHILRLGHRTLYR